MSSRVTEELRTLYARDLKPEDPEEHWLVRDVWARSAVGVIGGAAKSYKSFFALDLAFSVASGTPALGRFPVEDAGPALVYLAEDSLPQVRTRIEALCCHRAVDIASLPLLAITEPTLRLDTARDQNRLRRTIARYAPRLLLLDPLVRIHALDENDCHEISRLLGYFRELQRTFDLAIMIVHHVSKRGHVRPGQALRGSSDLHAFGDSNAYLKRRGELVILTLEHRASSAPAPMALRLISSGSPPHLEIVQESLRDEGAEPIAERVLRLLQTSRKPLSRTEIRARLRVNNARLGEVLEALREAGSISRTAAGWSLRSDPANGSQEPRENPQQALESAAEACVSSSSQPRSQ